MAIFNNNKKEKKRKEIEKEKLDVIRIRTTNKEHRPIFQVGAACLFLKICIQIYGLNHVQWGLQELCNSVGQDVCELLTFMIIIYRMFMPCQRSRE